jgi:branched-chain amino acid aminotransferase
MSDERQVWWNGEIVAADEARVSVFDTGFLYGDGIYETMRAYGGRVFARNRHLERLGRSAAAVTLSIPDREVLRRALDDTVAANGGGDQVVRLTVTRGRLARRLDLSTSGPASVLVSTDPVDPEEDVRRRHGIHVIHSRFLRLSTYPLAGVKSTNYQVSLFARNEARAAGAQEVLIPNESGAIVEGAASNVFLVEGARLVTPPLESGILGGITREVVLELAAARDLPVEESPLPRERIDAAAELFLSGTTIQIAPAVDIGGRPIGNGRPGPVTLQLLDDYLAAVAKDTGVTIPAPVTWGEGAP